MSFCLQLLALSLESLNWGRNWCPWVGPDLSCGAWGGCEDQGEERTSELP